MVRATSKPPTNPRQGFTLIELLIVVVILAILAALLVPAISGVRRRAAVAQVRSEISALESAIASFKAEFGYEPPGSIRIFGTQAGWNTSVTGVNETIRIRSRAYIRQIWPQFDFYATATATPGGVVMVAPFADTLNPYKDLNGAECLVFFLGGIGTSGNSLNGFSKSPTSPFSPSGTNRTKPFFDFIPARLVDRDGDTAPEYLDTIPNQRSPYLYFSSNDGQSYPTWTDSVSICNVDCYQDGFFQSSTVGSASWQGGNWMLRCYYTDVSKTVPFLAKKFQIISPGYGGIGAVSPDLAYGIGGYFDPKTSSVESNADRDNITNFHPTTLSNE